MVKIVVTTPTGRVGSRVVQLLLQAGVRPTLLLRDPARLGAETRALVDCAQADQRDADAILAATEGTDALYWVSPPTDAEDPIAAHAAMGAITASAIEQHGIGRVVFQSSVGAERRSGTGEIDGLAALGTPPPGGSPTALGPWPDSAGRSAPRRDRARLGSSGARR